MENRKSILPQVCHSFHPLAECDLQDIAFPAIAYPDANIEANIYSHFSKMNTRLQSVSMKEKSSPWLMPHCPTIRNGKWGPFLYTVKIAQHSQTLIPLSICRVFLLLMFTILPSNFLSTKRFKNLSNEPHLFASISFSSCWFLDFPLIIFCTSTTLLPLKFFFTAPI